MYHIFKHKTIYFINLFLDFGKVFSFSTQKYCRLAAIVAILLIFSLARLTSSRTASEEEYRRRYNDLTDRFRAEEEKLKRLTAERKKRDAESVAIGGMLFELTETPAPPIEFDEKLWHAVVDHVTVYNDDRLVYSLKDGTEITVEL